MKIEDVARMCYEGNKGLCEAFGDTSHPSWDYAAEWQRESAIAGAKAHIAKNLSPRESHEAWMEHKANEGWKYGRVKKTGLKEHPCYMRFDELPKSEQAKDYVFRAIVRACVKVDTPRG